MDDDKNRSLDFAEFKKGIRDYGLYLEPKVICCHEVQGAVYIHVHVAWYKHEKVWENSKV